jgi:hypothetical protein
VSMIADRDIYFASRRGIHSLRRVQEYGDLESASIDNEVSDKWRGLNDNSRAQAVAVDDFGNDTWWVFYDSNGDGKNDRGLLFNYRHQTSRGNPRVSEVDFGANAAVAFRSASTNREALLTGGIADGKVYSEHNPEANDDGVEFTWSATLAGIDGGESMTTKAWQDLTLMYDNWGLGTFDVEWYGDNHAPSSSTLSLDPHGAPIPMRGVRSGNVRGLPDPLAGMDMVHMMEGGRRIHIKLSGSRGRLRLRGMRLSYMPGRFDVTSDRHMPYTTTFPVSGA